MTAQSKASKAAQLRVKQIRAEFRASLFAPLGRSSPTYEYKSYTLDELEKEIDGCLRAVAKLVEEHNLAESILTDSRKGMVHELYEEAGSRKDHAWQARFAKKYGI